MTDFRYGHVFGDAMDALYRRVGVDADYRTSGRMFYTAESHVRHLREAKAGEALYATTQVLSVDDKRLQVFHRLYRTADEVLVATAEHLNLHVDTAAAKAAPMPAELRARLEALARAHARLGMPAEAGRAVGASRQR